MANTKRNELKKTLIGMIADTEMEIEELHERIKTGKHTDYAVCFTKMQCLETMLFKLNKLNDICSNRNRY